MDLSRGLQTGCGDIGRIGRTRLKDKDISGIIMVGRQLIETRRGDSTVPYLLAIDKRVRYCTVLVLTTVLAGTVGAPAPYTCI